MGKAARTWAGCLAAMLLLGLGASPPAWAAKPAKPGQTAAAPAPALFPSLLDLKARNFEGLPPAIKVAEPLPPALQFSLPVPNLGWLLTLPPMDPQTASLPPIAELGPRPLAIFMAPGGPETGYIEVSFLQLTREVDHADWLRVLWEQWGAKPQDAPRLVASAGGLALEVLAQLPPESGATRPRLMRAAAYRSGDVIFLLRCMADADHFPKLAYQFAAATLFFTPEVIQPARLVGGWSERCLGPACFLAPAAKMRQVDWSGRPQAEEVWELEQDGAASGSLHVLMVAPPAAANTLPKERLNNLAGGLAMRGLRLRGETREVDLPASAPLRQAAYYSGAGQSQGLDWEVLAFSAMLDDQAVTVWLLTPGPGTHPRAWLYNKRVFEVAIESLKRGGGR